MTDTRRILLLDPEARADRLRARLTASGYSVVKERTLDDAVSVLEDGYRPHLLVYRAFGKPAAAVERIRGVAADLPLVVLVAGDGEMARVYPRLVELNPDRAEAELDEAIHSLIENPDSGRAPEDEGMIVGSDTMRAIRDLLAQVADTDVSVLITGDSGVGKEVVARELHRRSDRARQPFVKVNCAALPDQLLESELFGYEPGAFTGADRRKPGKFELAHGGTIFLDEIGEISAGTQAKLLQVLQDGCYYRLGGNEEIRVDARVVASTNRDLEEEMAEGGFRKDLFYRLNVVRVEVPSLRERLEEVPLLAAHFLRRYEREYGREVGALSSAALDALSRHDWPGNVRELQNLVRRMVVLEDVDGVVAALGSRSGGGDKTGLDVDALIGPDGELPPLKEVSRLAALEVEGELIRRALERTSWNRREAARLLEISYKALLYKIRDCGITAA